MPAPQRCLSRDQVARHCREHDFAEGRRATTVGLELEWLTLDPSGRRLRLEDAEAVIAEVSPGITGGHLSLEPGGQIELSTSPFPDAALACAAAAADLLALDQACTARGIGLVALGQDPTRAPERVVTAPRYRAMESYFDALGTAGRTMMCNTAALQVNLCLGDPAQQVERWRLAHQIGPALIAAFANSPFADGAPTGWQSSRLRTWWMLDPSRSAPVPIDGDPAERWLRYALDARVMLIRVSDDDFRALRRPMSFGQWLDQGHELGFPTIDDLVYHLTTLFPPVRPKGWLELRMFDALPTPFWHVATAVAVALLHDPDTAAAAGEAVAGTAGLWLEAAQLGLGHPLLASAARRCFELAIESLERQRADTLAGVAAAYHDRWVARGRSPADDRLDAWHRDGTLWPPRASPVPYAEDLDLSAVLP